MKITTSKDSLLKGIQAVQNAVSSKNTLPILSHVLLEAKKDSIKLIATDLEIGVSVLVEGEVSEEGAITIPARTGKPWRTPRDIHGAPLDGE